MALVASLGMYDGPAQQDANDLFWELIADRLVARGIGDVPLALDRSRSLDEIWSDPKLLLAQSCGYPLVTEYRDRLRYVATPRYTAPGCIGAHYRSRIVVRAGDPAETLADLRGRTAAVNGSHSNSGMNLFRAAVAPLARDGRFFADIVETGSHQASVAAVAEGVADVAAIDTVSFEHIVRDASAIARDIRTIGWTAPSPGLPLVTSIATPDAIVHVLRDVLDEVVRSAEFRPVRDALFIDGMERLPADAYDELVGAEQDAARLRYPELA